MKTKVLILLSALFISATTLDKKEDVWGPTGHRATGEIARNAFNQKS